MTSRSRPERLHGSGHSCSAITTAPDWLGPAARMPAVKEPNRRLIVDAEG